MHYHHLRLVDVLIDVLMTLMVRLENSLILKLLAPPKLQPLNLRYNVSCRRQQMALWSRHIHHMCGSSVCKSQERFIYFHLTLIYSISNPLKSIALQLDLLNVCYLALTFSCNSKRNKTFNVSFIKWKFCQQMYYWYWVCAMLALGIWLISSLLH